MTRDETGRDLFACIEGRCDRWRIHSALGGITREQAERDASQICVRETGGGSVALPPYGASYEKFLK
ncbi:hypothetical protein FV217_13435 [Methylobacterium sp. WL9]|nr:hypothetical protein FV217_13435 [Methylobacterium sp. WL9]